MEGRMEHDHSAVERLLQEISWEGNARHYRKGGRGFENVLTAEVFQVLDFLPRSTFFGETLRRSKGDASSALELLASEAEDARFSLLPGDIGLGPLDASGKAIINVQPDVLIKSPSVYCFVEAKRFGRSSFQRDQLAREFMLVLQEAGERVPLLLLVLPKEPPIQVDSNGRMSLEAAVSLGVDSVCARISTTKVPDVSLVAKTIAFTTWDNIAIALGEGLTASSAVDPSALGCVTRLVNSARSAIAWHAVRD